MRGRCGFAGAAATLVSLATMLGCTTGDKIVNGQMSMKGSVSAVQSQDGTQCWKFTSTSGKIYELQPAQVPRDMLVDGQEVAIVAKPRTGGGSFCKLGEIIDVVSDSATAATKT
jgi:hypothetical protein